MERTREFLFASWEGGGNIPPLLTVARRLLARGHKVRALGDDASADEFVRAGVEFIPWREGPNRADKSPATDPMREWEMTDPAELLPRLIDRITCGPALGYARDVVAELTRRPADAVICSDLQLGPMVGAEAAGIPYAVLACNLAYLPIPDVPPFGPGLLPAGNEEERRLHQEIFLGMSAQFASGAVPINAARQHFGLAPLASMLDQLSRADRYLVATAEAFDYPGAARPANMRFVGPLLDPPGWSAHRTPDWADPSRPLVLVAFSTTFQDQEPVLRRVVDALAGMEVNAVVTLGPAGTSFELEAPDHVRLCESAPHDLILSEADLMITHAGHGSVMRALTAGVPLLCLPMGRDQNDNAARVEWHQAGLRLSLDAAPGEIAAAAARLLHQPEFRIAAGRLGSAIRAETNPDIALAELEALAVIGALRPAA